MKEYKRGMNITKIDKYQKNGTAILWWSKKHMNIIKYKKLNMTEHKTDMNITKIDRYKTNWTTILWRSTKQMNIIQKTKHDETQKRHEHY